MLIDLSDFITIALAFGLSHIVAFLLGMAAMHRKQKHANPLSAFDPTPFLNRVKAFRQPEEQPEPQRTRLDLTRA